MENPAAPSKSLPADGMSRWKQIQPFSPFSREKFRQLVIAGKAPQPVKFSERCTAYPNRELHRFFVSGHSTTSVDPPRYASIGSSDVPRAQGSNAA